MPRADEVRQGKLEQKASDKTDTDEALKELNATISSKTAAIQLLSVQVSELNAELEQAEERLENATALRKQEHEVYQAGSRDRRLALEVLKQAATVLRKFYATKEKTSFAQARARDDPPETWQNGTSTRKEIRTAGAEALLERVAKDITKEEQDAANDERAAEAAFEQFKEDDRTSFDQAMQEITAHLQKSATLKVTLGRDRERETQLGEDTQALALQLESLHGQCDELLQHFVARTKARSFELAQLKDVYVKVVLVRRQHLALLPPLGLLELLGPLLLLRLLRRLFSSRHWSTSNSQRGWNQRIQRP